MRLFFAVEISDDVRSAIAELQDELRPRLRSARWARPENLHLTLRFLGESDPSVVEEIERALVERVAAFERFTLRFRGCGAFPSPTRPRVLWVGIEKPDRALFRLQTILEQAARSAGFAPEKRPYRPHLTVARFRKPDRVLAEVAPSLSERTFGEATVSELVLFESRLAPAGASYLVARRFAMGGTVRKELL